MSKDKLSENQGVVRVSRGKYKIYMMICLLCAAILIIINTRISPEIYGGDYKEYVCGLLIGPVTGIVWSVSNSY